MGIRLLDQNTINIIAAGEVIENASSVVKELLENSIDAQAKNINIIIEESGLKLIKIVDDGIGIKKDEIVLAFKEHATSKISSIDDLESIMSFGFRGEALPSIASVSDMSIITRSVNDNLPYGYKYIVGSNNLLEEASNIGTTVLVQNLFERMPVRKKFLKSINTENGRIVDIVTKLAMSNTEVSFNLVVDGKQKFYSNGDGDLKQIILKIYGKEIFNSLIEVDDESNGIKLKGYIAKPIVARNTRNDEIYFVNRRYIKSQTISKAIEAAYETNLMQHKFPLAVLNVDFHNKLVDVNVHPRKMEVRFSNDSDIYFAIYNIITNKLKSVNLIHEEKIEYNSYDDNRTIDKLSDTNYKIVEKSNKLDIINKEENISEDDNSQSHNLDFNGLPTLSDVLNIKVKEGLSTKAFNNNLFKTDIKKYEEKSLVTKSFLYDYKYIGQIFNTYILIEYEDKIYIIDQHAAHEKINFEKLMKQYEDKNVEVQNIFPSIVLKLTPKQYAAIYDNLKEFEKVGYEISIFGDSEVKIDAVPYNIFGIANEKLLLDMIDSFVDETNKEHYDSIVEKIASISCKKSIKANHVLTEIESKQLIKELLKLDNPFNCPHGRPVIITISKYEFEKKFGRVI